MTENTQDTDFDLDGLDDALADFDGVLVEGGFDGGEDDSCPGGACKI